MLVVEQINLLFTVFHRVQDHKMVQIPNINLNSAAIHNVSRSQPMRERLTLHIAFDTPAADIELFKSSLEVFVQQPANKRDFQPNVETELILATELGKLELIVDFGYKSNLANESLRTSRRNKFYCILIDTVRKLPITGPGGGGPSLGDVGKPSFSVSITPDEALAQKKKVEEDRATKRQAFVPPTLVDTGVSSGIDIQRA